MMHKQFITVLFLVLTAISVHCSEQKLRSLSAQGLDIQKPQTEVQKTSFAAKKSAAKLTINTDLQYNSSDSDDMPTSIIKPSFDDQPESPMNLCISQRDIGLGITCIAIISVMFAGAYLGNVEAKSGKRH